MEELPARTASFPSMQDLRNLRQLLKNSKFEWSGLSIDERWRYHAYDYAFLRVRHGLDNRNYPLDPDGKWFNAALCEAAERIYQPRKPLYSGERPRPADTVRDPQLAGHFRAQDAERLPLKRQVQIHGERLANGDPTPEMLAFMACCARQAEANAAIYARRNRKAFAPEARMSQAQINEALGVSATEQRRPKHEDPEELRRSRIELGLEDAPESYANGVGG